MSFDPEFYSITIRKEEIDNELLYVGRVAEFPNICVYEENYETARILIIDAIMTLRGIAEEKQVDFPLPFVNTSEEFSGRVTLRLPKSLHAKIARNAIQENTSINQYLVTAVATYLGEMDGIAKYSSAIEKTFRNIAPAKIEKLSHYDSIICEALDKFGRQKGIRFSSGAWTMEKVCEAGGAGVESASGGTGVRYLMTRGSTTLNTEKKEIQMVKAKTDYFVPIPRP